MHTSQLWNKLWFHTLIDDIVFNKSSRITAHCIVGDDWVAISVARVTHLLANQTPSIICEKTPGNEPDVICFSRAGSIYDGRWLDGKWNGCGELIHKNHRFVGYYEDGLPTGKGKYVFSILQSLFYSYVFCTTVNDKLKKSEEFVYYSERFFSIYD